jgi:hypothetical protein
LVAGEGEKITAFKGNRRYRFQGLAEGRTKEKLEITRKMKQAGRPLTEITEFLGLSSKGIQGL